MILKKRAHRIFVYFKPGWHGTFRGLTSLYPLPHISIIESLPAITLQIPFSLTGSSQSRAKVNTENQLSSIHLLIDIPSNNYNYKGV